MIKTQPSAVTVVCWYNGRTPYSTWAV